MTAAAGAKLVGGAGLLLWLLAQPPALSAQEPASPSTTNLVPSSAFQGSVPGATPVSDVLPLSLGRAVELGLANNLGLLLNREVVTSARGERWVALAQLLPNLSGSASAHHLKESLASTGITLPGAPTVVGPFNYYDARVSLSQRIFDLSAIERERAAAHRVSAAEFSEQDAKDLVVLTVGAGYLQALAGQARIETVRAQLATAQTMLEHAVEMHRAGVTPGIDEVRARVEWLTRSQQLIVVENEFAKQKLSLLRLIGLPLAQEVALVDREPFLPMTTGTLGQHLEQALAARADYRAARSELESAHAGVRAARTQRMPSLVLNADYGEIGRTLSQLEATYQITGSLSIPIFEGGRIHGDVVRAEAQVRQREAELADLRGRIEYEIRSALLDLGAARLEVSVARQTVELAETNLWQAEERFRAGLNDNLEVVQAQQSVAAAQEGVVDSQYRLNLAKLMLARAIGIASFAGHSPGR
ncbi:outer membrane efflux protein [Geomonas limicola]|uniref:Outer membrane efflux protein n=1 Tax=Geomonas limicola TaxID=2740186 RepID=A0A6V8N5E6_9BACT|nr:TolC family protein [Geomonas limicola]GFO66519.1 outer membrane efflux protein [Geomonas limicola]